MGDIVLIGSTLKALCSDKCKAFSAIETVEGDDTTHTVFHTVGARCGGRIVVGAVVTETA